MPGDEIAVKLSLESTAAINELCQDWYEQLIQEGVDEGVAADRVWDAMRCGLGDIDGDCFDKRDRMLQDEIERIVNED